MSVTLPAPGRLHAALQACYPAGLPDWLIVSPRCGTAAPVLQLDDHQAEELADLAALVLGSASRPKVTRTPSPEPAQPPARRR